MVHVEVSCIIHAPKEKVYEINANYACWPQAFPHIKSVRLISEKGNERHLESTVMNLKGKTHVVRSVQRIVSPDRIEEEVLANRGLTVKIIYNYQTTPEGTHIVVTNCLQPRHNNIL